ncbi:glutathione-disulfide reductase [Silvimonas amylolytica]|uniref:Glutathione-disulfide reductase n=1 Tax=Silvimonas amylolytica TaxID=449663 RepID=A0ABQ2PM47_9NEIS|nr:glutathione-disulfide reductase [Silvimonas amylolytica]GGP26349.1 glutathione-disulfide reductase [Silvimonas amylolytica]
MQHPDVDLFVIGGGSGGVRAARIAASHGARVAIAESANFGGTCVNRGCVPKKLMVYASRFPDQFKASRGYGWSPTESVFNWHDLITHKDTEINRLEGIYRTNLEKSGVSIHADHAEIVDAHTILLGLSGQRVTAGTILIATGGHPTRPDFPGNELAITSDEAFHLPELPERVLIVGGGYIAVEFAGIFAGLGSEVTQVIRGDHLLRGFDTEVAGILAEHQARRGIKLVRGQSLQRIVQIADGLRATLSDGLTLDVDTVMLCTGRAPNTRGLGLANVDVKTNEHGAIVADRHGRTNVPSIYAIGDVTDRLNLTPVAIREGQAFADRLYGGLTVPDFDYEMVPTAVFSTPEIGTVGLPEHIARERYPQLKVLKTKFRAMTQLFGGLEDQVFVKVLIDGPSDKVVGLHLLGDGTAEMAQLIGVALTANATWADFRHTVALHPTVAEEIVTLKG